MVIAGYFFGEVVLKFKGNPMDSGQKTEFAGYLRQMQREEAAELVKTAASCLNKAKLQIGQQLASAAGLTFGTIGCHLFDSEGDQFIRAFMGAQRVKGYPLLPGWFAGKAARSSGEHRLSIEQAQRQLIVRTPAPRERSLGYGAGEE